MLKHALPLVLLSLLVAGCAVEGPQTAGAESPIVDGSREEGYPEVMFLYNVAVGSACTATLISPRVVLTAKHCVQQGDTASASSARNFRLFAGLSANRATKQYSVSQVIVAPGRWDLRDASDVALLILPAPADAEPREVSFESPRGLTGETFTAIGYGQTPTGSSGVKMRVQKRVDGFNGGFIYVRPSVCSGDSGGPLIGADGSIYGVASYIYSETRGSPICGTAPGAYNAIQPFQAMIEAAIEETGGCVPTEEICNGGDDNCDGVVDEGCSAVGELCASASECSTGECEETEVGRICTQTCDPMRPSFGCETGFFCQNTGDCRGLCAPESASALALGEECAMSSDCTSGFCAAVGEATMRCHTGCRDGSGHCLAGEVCFSNSDSCGACVPAFLVDAPRSMGEPCSLDGDCEDGTCFAEAGLSYCSRTCAAQEDCGDGFHCRDELCVRGPLQDVGGECVTNGDCAGSFCAQQGGRGWCSRVCAGIDDCPTGFSCLAAGDQQICVPANGLVGDECAGNEDCILGLCAAGTPHGSVCSRFCGVDSACAAGFECARVGDEGLCVRPVEEEEEVVEPPPADGCSIGSSAPSAPIGLIFVLGAVWLRRRPRA